MTVKLLTEHHLEFLRLKGGCTGSSESIHVKVPHCWKSHVVAQMSKSRLFCTYTNFMQHEKWHFSLIIHPDSARLRQFSFVSIILSPLACTYPKELLIQVILLFTGPHSAIGSKSHCRSRGHEFDSCMVPYFCGDLSWNIFYRHSPPSADSRMVGVSYKLKYVHALSQACTGKSVARLTDHLYMNIAVDWDVKPQTKQTKKSVYYSHLMTLAVTSRSKL